MFTRLAMGALLVSLGVFSEGVPARAAVPHPAPIPERASVPLGSALWYACADAAYSGPAPLRCPVSAFDARYAQTFAERFDRLTPENEFKMAWTQPQRGQFDFAVADAVVRFARAQDKPIRGHTLVYAAANPGWVENPGPLRPWNRETLSATMRTHITTMVDRYQGDVREWDVVNEPFMNSGAREPNVYERIIGPDWIEQAFRAANAADPEALLILNEFNADIRGPRQQAVLALVTDFVRRGVPIDGVGLEMHTGSDGSYPTLTELKDVMAGYAALGLRVEITEADALRPGDPNLDATLVQRAAYDTVARACQESPNCTGLTVWGVADAYSWRGLGQTSTLFTQNFGKKRAYDLVRCRLADLKPATGVWTPRDDCGPVQGAPPATTTPPGPTDGSSVESNVPDPQPAPLTAPSPVMTSPASAPAPPTLAPPPVAPRAAADRATVRLVHPRPTRKQLAKGVVTKITGTRPRTPVTVRLRRSGKLITATTRPASSSGAASLTTKLPAAVLRALRSRAVLTVTVSFIDAKGTRVVQQLTLRVR